RCLKILRLIEYLLLITVLLIIALLLYNNNKNYLRGGEAIRINSADKKTISKLKYIEPVEAEIIIANRPIKTKKQLVDLGVITNSELNDIRFDFVTQRQEESLKQYLEE
ncbi:MAG: hypothetical protein ACRC0V_06145, partial [Fusobacteriaceae bacterium]